MLRDTGRRTPRPRCPPNRACAHNSSIAEGKSYGGPAAINGRVLNLLSAAGPDRPRAVRAGRGPAASTNGHRSRSGCRGASTPIARRAGADRTGRRRGWTRFGPATVADIVWWTGWNHGDTRRALAALDTVTVDLDGETGSSCRRHRTGDRAEPWIALLPALDPTPMGWSGRDWYIEPEHRATLFDRTGNIGPSVWCDGRIVGGWGQRADGVVVWRLFADIGRPSSKGRGRGRRG